MQRGWIWAFALLIPARGASQPGAAAQTNIARADQIAWMRAWPRAERLFADAEREFTQRGDRRNRLYAEISKLRCQLSRLAIPLASQRLAEYLDDPTVRTDDRLRLRCLIIKGEVDEDLDPALAEVSWREALQIAGRLKDVGWANRARGELGVVAAMQGDVNGLIVDLNRALQVATKTGDFSSQVRWLTILGHGYARVGKAEESLVFYDKALRTAAKTPELEVPVMSYLGKGDALTKLGRHKEALELLNKALAIAAERGSKVYQAEITMKLAVSAKLRKNRTEATRLFNEARTLARSAGDNRILAEIALEQAKAARDYGAIREAKRAALEGIAAARQMHERLLLPRLLAQQAEVDRSEGRSAGALKSIDEASDIVEGLLVSPSSPWVRSRLVGVMDEVFSVRLAVEQVRNAGPDDMFRVIEQARARSMRELLRGKSLSDRTTNLALVETERETTQLQAKLFQVSDRRSRKRLLDQLILTEAKLAPLAAAAFSSSRAAALGRPKPTLSGLQAILKKGEVLLEYALAEPASVCLVVTREGKSMAWLPGRKQIETSAAALMTKIDAGQAAHAEAKDVFQHILAKVPDDLMRGRVIICPDGILNRIPFDLLEDRKGETLLSSHSISFAPSASVLATIRDRSKRVSAPRLLLAVSTSGPAAPQSQNYQSKLTAASPSRGMYDVEPSTLPLLPLASSEARAVAAIATATDSRLLIDEAATEKAVKREPLHEYRIIHFATHGLVSEKYPERSAIVLKPSATEDGLLQAREILHAKLNADLVTLSACRTAAGAMHGQDGVFSLARPFLVAGARSVVANLWAADDSFSFALMKEFYSELSKGTDGAEALRRSKLAMIARYGPEATPKQWSGLVLFGDGAGAPFTRNHQ